MVNIFIDFDGTITLRDVGDSMFEHFGGEECTGYIDDYRKGRISARECFTLECGACGDIDKGELDSFLDSQEIDPHFAAFLEFACARKIQCHILSDGMDYYIRYILSRHGLDVPFFSNRMELQRGEGKTTVSLEPSFPYPEEVCTRCAFCKRNHMLTVCADEDIIIYIGEGYSDRCPAHYADVVFAKDGLLKYCRRENITFFEYRTFEDIRARLTLMLDQKGGKKNAMRKRRRAQLERRGVFAGG